MSKKNSSVTLKNFFKDQNELNLILVKFIEKLKKFKEKKFVIAVSGGPDSLALTALAKAYSLENKCKMKYVLVNHNIRVKSSQEANNVKKLLKQFNISLKILNNSRTINKNVQSNAREIRYNLLKKFCKKNKIKIILTAHNLEDQVETFLIRLSRGSGLHGLSSMNQSNKLEKNIILARPLLEYKKQQLIKISKSIFGKYYKDPSNENTKYLRTKIRKLKKPLEKSGINYIQIIKSIKNLAASRDTLNLYFDRIYKETIKKRNNKILIDYKNFDLLNSEMKMRTLRQSIKDLTKAYYYPRSKKIINLVSRIKLDRGDKLHLSGCLIFKDKNNLIIKKAK